MPPLAAGDEVRNTEIRFCGPWIFSGADRSCCKATGSWSSSMCSRVAAAGLPSSAAIIDGPAVCRMLNTAMAKQYPPQYLSSDNDPLFKFHRWLANRRALDIEEIKSLPFVPRSHPLYERLIWTIREELLNQIPFWNQLDLERKLSTFRTYYYRHRVHGEIGGIPPAEQGASRQQSTLPLSDFRWVSHCHGFFELPAVV